MNMRNTLTFTTLTWLAATTLNGCSETRDTFAALRTNVGSGENLAIRW